MSEELSDTNIIDGMLNGDENIVEYFFFEKCAPTFRYLIHRIFGGQMEKHEFINELYLFLQADDWRKLRQFDYRKKWLTKWV